FRASVNDSSMLSPGSPVPIGSAVTRTLYDSTLSNETRDKWLPATLRAVRSPSRTELDAMIADATVDCYNESECVTGLYTMIEEPLEVPFQTEVLGVDVTVTGIDMDDDDHIVAICTRGRWRQRISILDLPLPTSPPAGAQWIEAYRHWLT